MLNLNDLYYFVRVVEQKGFSAAARSLSVPKSTLSKRVAELENHLGARLINRTTRGFCVTDVGEDFYRHAVATLMEAESAEAAVKERLGEPCGVVRITASIAATHLVLVDLLPVMAEAFPKVQIALHTSNADVDIIQEGFDLAVRSHSGPLPDSDLVQRPLRTDFFYLVASPDYLARRGVPQHPEDLVDHHGLLSDVDLSYGWQLQHRASGLAASVNPISRVFADEVLTRLKAACEGCGIASLPSICCQRELENGTLVRVLPGWTGRELRTTLLMSHRRGQLPSVRKVADFLVKTLSATDQG